jgi:hypothetical protein
MAGTHLRRVLAHRAAKRAKRRRGIHADGYDEHDCLKRRPRDMLGMHGDEDRSFKLLRQTSGPLQLI